MTTTTVPTSSCTLPAIIKLSLVATPTTRPGNTLSAHKDVKNVDLLIAPHHGRSSKRSYDFLDVLKPRMTFFGNARAEHLAYSAWNYRKLPFMTNNQAGCMIVDVGEDQMNLYVTNERFAKAANPSTFYSSRLQGYYYGGI